MRLSELLPLLDQHGVSLTLTDAGKLRPTAEQQPPAELIEGLKAHRAVLVRRLERGQTPSGHYHLPTLAARHLRQLRQVDAGRAG